ncbi:d-arabinono- -lactone oxidase [Ophiostoma piceae UAMH 11346]|uniref:D-arabinono-1,4-lactone oxidase n=1 Tax=Ophiostoma piceae (strain UAMH 11346) TaxID=1262450 RepID=S3BQW0_OPHP1|nr:d-arabinono- -lactone oxidase [Ophiostoma piceae UAMH 11346]
MASSFNPADYDGVDLSLTERKQPFLARRNYVHATWARTFTSHPDLFIQPETIEEVENAIKLARHRRRRIATTGCGHSPSDITCTSSWLINLDRLKRISSIDRASCLVTVEAGIRLKDLSAELAKHELALPNLGSINEQSLAGACATGTHGSSLRHGLLSDDIVALKITLSDGTTKTCKRDTADEDENALFRAALLSLGALGIVVEITLRAVPAFRLRWSQTVNTDAVAFDRWRQGDTDGTCRNSELWTQAHFVRVWWFPYTRRAVVWAAEDCDKTPEEEPNFTPPTSYYDSNLGYLVYHNLLYLGRFVPRILPWVEWFVFGMQYGFRNGTTTSGLQPSDQALLMNCLYSQFVNEWAIPLARGPEALTRLGAWLNHLKLGDAGYVDHGIPFSADGLYVHAPVEVRVADTAALQAASTSPLSTRPFLDPTSTDSPTLYLNATMYRAYHKDPPGLAQYYEAFEWLMRDIGGKPHWAKNFGSDHKELAAAYGDDLAKFNKVRNASDPDGMFVGPWQRRYLLGASADSLASLPNEEHEVQRSQSKDSSFLITGKVDAAER